MGSLSPLHWLVVILVILILFGSSRVAGLGKGLGEGIRAFKKGITEDPPEEKASGEPKQIPRSTDGRL
jgi:sec-independent protein translocase protein TatA